MNKPEVENSQDYGSSALSSSFRNLKALRAPLAAAAGMAALLAFVTSGNPSVDSPWLVFLVALAPSVVAVFIMYRLTSPPAPSENLDAGSLLLPGIIDAVVEDADPRRLSRDVRLLLLELLPLCTREHPLGVTPEHLRRLSVFASSAFIETYPELATAVIRVIQRCGDENCLSILEDVAGRERVSPSEHNVGVVADQGLVELRAALIAERKAAQLLRPVDRPVDDHSLLRAAGASKEDEGSVLVRAIEEGQMPCLEEDILSVKVETQMTQD